MERLADVRPLDLRRLGGEAGRRRSLFPRGARPPHAANAYLTSFELAYAPGTLVAEGLAADGTVLDRAELRTAGEPDHVRYSRETIGRLIWVTAEVVDKDGTVCPYADREIDFGEKAIATCSGDLADNVPAPARTRKAWLGRALGILRGVR